MVAHRRDGPPCSARAAGAADATKSTSSPGSRADGESFRRDLAAKLRKDPPLGSSTAVLGPDSIRPQVPLEKPATPVIGHTIVFLSGLHVDDVDPTAGATPRGHHGRNR